MSHGCKNTIIAMLVIATGYFYALNNLQTDLIDDAMQLCFFGEAEATVAGVASKALGKRKTRPQG